MKLSRILAVFVAVMATTTLMVEAKGASSTGLKGRRVAPRKVPEGGRSKRPPRHRRRLNSGSSGDSGGGGKGGGKGGSSGGHDDIKFENRFPCQFCGEANDSGLNGEICFSGAMTVQLEPGNVRKMSDLKVGDRILTANGNYEPVYAWGHTDATQEATFLQVYTNQRGQKNPPLEVTHEHLVFLQGQTHPVRAGSLKVGDILQSSSTTTAVIRKIRTVQRRGVYAPLTTSGTLVVNGIMASSYIASTHQRGSTRQDDSVLWPGTQREIPILSHQTAVHMLLSPFRLLCSFGAGWGVCNPESMLGSLVYNINGIPHYVAAGIALRKVFTHSSHAPFKHVWIQWILIVLALLVTGPVRLVEFIIEQAVQWDAFLDARWGLDVPKVTLAAAVTATLAAGWSAHQTKKTQQRQRQKMR